VGVALTRDFPQDAAFRADVTTVEGLLGKLAGPPPELAPPPRPTARTNW